MSNWFFWLISIYRSLNLYWVWTGHTHLWANPPSPFHRADQALPQARSRQRRNCWRKKRGLLTLLWQIVTWIGSLCLRLVIVPALTGRLHPSFHLLSSTPLTGLIEPRHTYRSLLMKSKCIRYRLRREQLRRSMRRRQNKIPNGTPTLGRNEAEHQLIVEAIKPYPAI